MVMTEEDMISVLGGVVVVVVSIPVGREKRGEKGREGPKVSVLQNRGGLQSRREGVQLDAATEGNAYRV